MKDIPIIFSTPMVPPIMDGSKTETRRIMNPQPQHYFDGVRGEYIFPKRCPYGVPGDRLWVREAWDIAEPIQCPQGPRIARILYAADFTDQRFNEKPKWKSPIHLFKKDARLWLTRKSPARIERVQDITEAGARAEGFKNIKDFRAYWTELHGQEPVKRWLDNPWVWVPDWEPWKRQ